MNEPGDEKLCRLLKSTVAPVADSELKRDLWPAMLRKLDERAPRPLGRVAWFDWALVAILAAWLLLFPQVIPVLLYQL